MKKKVLSLMMTLMLGFFGLAQAQVSLPYEDGFENGIGSWTMSNCQSSTGVSTNSSYIHSGSSSFTFHWTTTPPQYLISPQLSGVTGSLNVEFYYKAASSGTYSETFMVGYSTTTADVSSFSFGEEITATAGADWALYSNSFPAGTKYIAIECTSNDAYYLCLDDFAFTTSGGGGGGGSTAMYDFEDSTTQGWTTIDADGDGYTWVLGSAIAGIYLVDGASLAGSGHNSSNDLMCSGSYSNVVGALTPDNYLVSPQVTLGGSISFYACGQDAGYAAEHFGVAVSTTSNSSASAFTTVQEWTLSAKSVGAPTQYTRSGNRDQGAWYQFTVDLSAYSGQGYIAIRHFNCTDQFILDVDDINISDGSGGGGGGSSESIIYDFENSTTQGWTTIDADGDGYTFVLGSAIGGVYLVDGASLAGTGHNSSNDLMCSGSFTNVDLDGDGYGDVLYPDNYMVSPQVTLGGSIDFWACGQDAGYAAEHFGVAVSTTSNNNASAFTTIQEWTLSAKSFGAPTQYTRSDSRAQGNWYHFTVDLSAYSGQGYIAIRHFNCSDEFILDIDDITIVEGTGGSGGQTYTITATPNPLEGGYITIAYRSDRDQTYDFEDGTTQGWTAIDADGDGFNWGLHAPDATYTNDVGHNESSYYFNSASYDNETSTALTPNNFLVSPQVTLGGTISFWAQAQDPNYAAEHFGVAVSTTSATNPSAFTTIQEWTMTAKSTGVPGNHMTRSGSRTTNTWYQFTADLSAYSGQGYVAIRHFNCTDMFILNVDDITITSGGSGGQTGQTVTGQFNEGQTCILTAIPFTGYHFVNWTENGTVVSTNAVYSFTVTGNRTLYANFSNDAGQTYTITAMPDPVEGGYVTIAYRGDRTVVFSDDFETGIGNWTTIDADGDGYTWYDLIDNNPNNIPGHNGSVGFATSASYQSAALTPDNYLVSPQVALNGTFSFWACGQDASWAAEHFGVAISTTNATSASAFTTIQEWTLSAKSGSGVLTSDTRDGMTRDQGNWYQFTVDLSSYAGQMGYIAIRHFDVTDMFRINVDDVELITNDGGQTGETVSATFEEGQTCILSAFPFTGYHFVNWTENGTVVSTNSVYSFTVTSNRTLVAHFSNSAGQTYTITATPNPLEGGYVTIAYRGEREQTTYDFDDSSMGAWTNIDADGDGYGWVLGTAIAGIYLVDGASLAGTGHNASNDLMCSGSYSNVVGALTPDNYLVSPQVQLGGSISFWACGQDSGYAEEHFGVAVSTTNNTSASAFTTIQEWTLSAKSVGAPTEYTRSGSRAQGNWYQFTVDLSAYSGQGYIAIRHFNCTDMFILDVDDIVITEGNGGGGGGGSSESVIYDFEDSTTQGWTNIDADGDGYSWVLGTAIAGIYLVDGASLAGTGHNASNDLMCSGSYSNVVGALTPDNYLVSPQVQLGGSISFWACGQDSGYAEEHFGVAVSTTNNTSASAFTTIQEWTLSAKSVGAPTEYTRSGSRAQGNWYQFTVDLSAYSGQTGYIAIRHFNCTDMFILDIDDITIVEGTGGSGEDPEMGETVSATFEEGQTCILSAFPFTGYHFVNWTENGTVVSTESVYSFTVTCDRNLVANFSNEPVQTYTITATPNPLEGGYITIEYIDGREEFFYDFEDNTTQGWTTIDADGDGFDWQLGSILMAGYLIPSHGDGADCMSSQSYDGSAGALTPDNYLVSPQVQLGGSITFWACAQDESYAAEHFGVAVSTTNNTSASAFTTLQEWTMSAKGTGNTGNYATRSRVGREGTWYEFTVDLSDYAGQTGYIAIRHFNCSDMFYLDVDDITIVEGASGGDTPEMGETVSAVFEEGQTCVLTAHPFSGYYFVNWTENGTEVSNTAVYSFPVTCDRNLVANFSQTPAENYTINAVADPTVGGTVTGAGTYAYGTEITLDVTLNEGYSFQYWTEGGLIVSYDQAYTFTVTGNRDLVACLKLDDDGVGEHTINVAIYPNPVSDKLNVEATEAIDQVEVFNINGAKVFSQKNNTEKTEINTANLPAGTYVIRMTTKSACEVRSFVKF